MPFDEEEIDPHGECAAEIKRQREQIALLERRAAKAIELINAVAPSTAIDALQGYFDHEQSMPEG